MITLSLCMIVKNEQAVLGRCLDSARAIADEIIIVDTGSNDRTKKIARQYTDKVFDFEWTDDFSAARNFAFSKGKCDFLMWLDADDVLMPQDAKKLLELKKTLPGDVDAVTMKYNLVFDGMGNPTFSSSRGRLFKRTANPIWHDRVHEYIPLVGKILYADGAAVTHMPKETKTLSERNLNIYKRILKEEGALSPRGKYYYARELKDHGKFEEAAVQFTAFIDEGKGWKEDNICACLGLGFCYKALKQPQKAFEALLKSFCFDAPRAEACCMIGYHCKDLNDFQTAALWFETALNLPAANNTLGFVQKDYCDFIPALEAAVCYDRLGNIEKANMFNELAGKVKPDSAQYLHNKEYFSKRLLNS